MATFGNVGAAYLQPILDRAAFSLVSSISSALGIDAVSKTNCEHKRRRWTVPLTAYIDEVGRRYSVFYLIGSLASAFGGILAYGVMQMDGIRGYGGWRWIFIIEGCVRAPQHGPIAGH